MIFKFLNRPITITAFASEIFKKSFEDYPIAPSSKFLPDWWKKTPKSNFNFDAFETRNTVKSCPGIVGTFQNGYIMPLWSDLAIKMEENGCQSIFGDNKSNADIHPDNQMPNFYENYAKMKLTTPWLLKSSIDIKYCFIQPFYEFSKPLPFITPYGITSSIKKTSATNVFLFLEKKRQNIMLSAGTPLIQIIPLTERPIIFKTEMISQIEMFKMASRHHSVHLCSDGLKGLKSQRGGNHG